MTFDELIEVLHGLPGRMVEATVSIADDGDEVRHVASFSGTVDSVTRGSAPALAEYWYVRWREDGEPKPGYGDVVIRRGLFEGADVTGSDVPLEEVMEEDDPSGTNWVITIRLLGGTVLTLDAYV